MKKLNSCIAGACLNSHQDVKVKRLIYQWVQERKIRILFISPERLMTEDFSKLGKISFVCIDEIHCASEWSHNFRPSFLKIKDVLTEKLQEAPLLLGLTATATVQTQNTLADEFDFENIMRCSELGRKNLSLTITWDLETNKISSLQKLIKSKDFASFKSILIYATYKVSTERIARYLWDHGIESKAYHAGLNEKEREYV